MRQNINPNRIILSMMPCTCPECERVQYNWFVSAQERNEWTCPYCSGRMNDDGDVSTPTDVNNVPNGEIAKPKEKENQ